PNKPMIDVICIDPPAGHGSRRVDAPSDGALACGRACPRGGKRCERAAEAACETRIRAVCVDRKTRDRAKRIDRIPDGTYGVRYVEGRERPVVMPHKPVYSIGGVYEVPRDRALIVDAVRDRRNRTGCIECLDPSARQAHEAVERR